MDLLATLKDLRPEERPIFKFGHERTLSNVQWRHEETIIPTLEECEAHWNDSLRDRILFENLRKKRDTLLDQTDKYIVADYPHPTEETKQAWLDYRQALRDFPANTVDPENPVWPEAPN